MDAKNHSPVNRLPLELLLEVWRYNISTSVTVNQKLAQFPVIASWVNRRWRNAAVKTPELWCHISVTLKQSSEYVHAQLQRSQALPLSIDITLPINEMPKDKKGHRRAFRRLQSILAKLISHLPRWQGLKVKMYGYDGAARYPQCMSAIFEPLCHAQMPVLKRLHIDITSNEGERPIDIFTGGTPNLTHVHFGGVTITKQLASLTRLTSLSLDHVRGISPAALQTLAAGCPSLADLSFCGSCIDWNYAPLREGDEIHLPALRSLTLSQFIWGFGGIDAHPNWREVAKWNCFYFFSAPNLRVLRILKAGPRPIDVIASVLQMSRPGYKYPLLSELHLSEVQGTKALTRELYRCVPSIDTLRIDDLSRPSRFECFEALIPDASVQATPICPNLRKLLWFTKSSPKFQRGRMKTLLEKRKVWDNCPVVQLELIAEPSNDKTPLPAVTEADLVFGQGEEAEIARFSRIML